MLQELPESRGNEINFFIFLKGKNWVNYCFWTNQWDDLETKGKSSKAILHRCFGGARSKQNNPDGSV